MISKKYNDILKKLEKNIENKKDFNLAKSAMSDLAICYIDEISKLTDNYTSRISDFEKRLAELESRIMKDDEIEEITITENIACPYCGFEFEVEYDDENHETVCPKCNNLIELDWGEFEDDM